MWRISGHPFFPSHLRGHYSPLFAPYVLRETSARFFEAALGEEEVFGIQRVAAGVLTDVLNKGDYIALQAEDTLHHARTLVWCLSIPEILHILPRPPGWLAKKWIKPDKVWRRFRLSWDMSGFEQVLPGMIFTVLDTAAAWEGANVMSIKRHPGSSEVSLWIQCAYRKTMDYQAICEQAGKALKVLFPGFSAVCTGPKSSDVPYFVCYEKDNFLSNFRRIFFLNPESTGKMDAFSLQVAAGRIKGELLQQIKGMVEPPA